MLFKEDWEKSEERFEAFWEGELVDRCCIAITSPRKSSLDSSSSLRQPKDLEEQWLNSEYRISKFLYECENTYFAGEAFPNFCVDLGPGVIASFVGCNYLLAKNTVWFDREPIIKDWNTKPIIKLDEKSEMWKILLSMSEEIYKNAKKKFAVGISDLGGNFDIAVSLRGTQELLCDLYDNPDEVKLLIEEIDRVWVSCCDRLYAMNKLYQDGYTSWMPLWCKQKWYPLQCDFSVMLSPAMFAEFVKPSLQREAEFLGKAIYHLDGPAQISHIDHIMEIGQIEGIEWVPMPQGRYLDTGSEEWYPLYKTIQAKGKKLVLRSMDPRCIEKLLENISPKGLFISTSCDSEEEAKELIKKVEKWSLMSI